MKYFRQMFLMVPLVTIPLWGMVAPQDPAEAEAFYLRLGASVERWAAEPNRDEKIKALGEYVRKFGRRMPDHPDPRWHEVFYVAREALLETPGHARYFADEVERLIADPANAGTDVRQRYWYLVEVLSHLPSPETVAVLGHYLYDERYPTPPGEHGSGAYGPTDRMAATALRDIGLRVSDELMSRWRGVTAGSGDVERWLAWWEEVERGERSFSFKGQALEHRFLPDGSWESFPIANPPDDGPPRPALRPEAGPSREERRPSPAVVAESAPGRRTRWWPWLAGAVVLAGAAAAARRAAGRA